MINLNNFFLRLLWAFEELDDGAGLVVDVEGDDVAAIDGVEGGGEQVTLFGGDAVLDAHVVDFKALGQQFHGDAHVVGVVHVAVVVDVGTHDLHGFLHGAVLLGQDDATPPVVHFLLGLKGERGDGFVRETRELARGEVHKGAHAPRAVTGFPLGVADERVAEAVHRHHLIDGSRHRQVLLETGYSHHFDLACGQQLCHVVVAEELAGRGLAVNPHFGAVLHHLEGRIELQLPLAVAGACRDFIVECVHELMVVK